MTESGEECYRRGFHDRLRFAWLRLKLVTNKDLTYDELAGMLARAGLGESVGVTTMSRWFRDRLPSAYTMCALAEALQVDPGWLAFGSASKAPRPDDPIAGLYRPHPQPDDED